MAEYNTKTERVSPGNSTCALCSDQSTACTVSLSCKHVFCRTCLVDHFEKLSLKYLVLCPVCGESTAMESNTVDMASRKSKVEANVVELHVFHENSGTNMENLSPDSEMKDFRPSGIESVTNEEPVSKTACSTSIKKYRTSEEVVDQQVSPSEARINQETSHVNSGSADNGHEEQTIQLCTDHQVEMKYFCRPCQKLVCKQCRLEYHKGHRTRSLKVLVDEKRKHLQGFVAKVKHERCDTLKQRLAAISVQMENLEKQKGEEEKKILERAEVVKQSIDGAKNETIKELKTKQSVLTTELQTKQMELQQELSKVSQDLVSSEDVLSSGTDLEVVLKSKQMKETLTTTLGEHSDYDTNPIEIRFEAGDLPDDVIRNGFGSCSVLISGDLHSCYLPEATAKARLISEFPCPYFKQGDDDILYDTVHAITYSSAGHVTLCGNWESSIVTTTDGQGRVTKSTNVGTKIDDITENGASEIVLSCYCERTIKKVKENDEILDFITTPFFPRGLCKSQDGGFIVCMVDQYSSSLGKESRRLLVKYDADGKQTDVIEYSDGKRLFTRPYRVAENINGEICVADKTSMGSGRVVVLDKSGKLKSIYPNSTFLNGPYPFSPAGLCCDGYGRILVTDTNNNRIHILDKDGQFVGFLSTENENIDSPCCITIDRENQIWIGSENGQIKVYKYE